MIILDTNIVSELLRPIPNPIVAAWTNQVMDAGAFVTSITVAEIQLGIATLPEGQRRSRLAQLAEETFELDFKNRCLSFDTPAAHRYASITAHRRAIGRPISQSDAMIAAIAQTRAMTLASRNVDDFVETGVKLHNPWNNE
jgi:toxin FitB